VKPRNIEDLTNALHNLIMVLLPFWGEIILFIECENKDITVQGGTTKAMGYCSSCISYRFNITWIVGGLQKPHRFKILALQPLSHQS